MVNLKDFKDEIGVQIYGIAPSVAKEQGICIDCREPALAKCYSEEGRAEYLISGLCELCFDRIMEDVTEDIEVPEDETEL